MFDFLDDVRDYFAPAKPAALEPAFGALPPPHDAESLTVPGVAPDFSGLSAWGESDDVESMNITAIETEGRRGEDLDELAAEHYVTEFRSIQEMADAVSTEADGAPLGRLEIVDHARPGVQEVGDQDLTLESLDDEDVAAALSQLRGQFGPDGALDLKGCRVGGDEEGDALLRALARQLDVPVSGSSEYQTPFLPGLDGPVKTCYPPEFDEETQQTWQTCTTTTNPIADTYDQLQEWIGGDLLGMEQSDME